MAAKKTTKKKANKKEPKLANGGTHSSVIWNKKSKEEKAQILLERKNKRAMDRKLDMLFEAKANEWLSAGVNATAVMMLKAIQEGDVLAYKAFMERVYGKPKDNKEAETESDNNDMIQAILALVGKLPD